MVRFKVGTFCPYAVRQNGPSLGNKAVRLLDICLVGFNKLHDVSENVLAGIVGHGEGW